MGVPVCKDTTLSLDNPVPIIWQKRAEELQLVTFYHTTLAERRMVQTVPLDLPSHLLFSPHIFSTPLQRRTCI